MLWNRGGGADYDDWVRLGNPGWGWDDLLPYFKKSETYTPVYSQETAEAFSVYGDPSVHGFDGPVNVSHPHYFWNASKNFFAGLNELSIPTSYDPNDGSTAGASFLPLNLDPVSQTRCTARRAYYDPVVFRPNIWVSTGQTVTQLLFADGRGNPTASKPNSGESVGEGGSPQQDDQIFGTGSVLNISSVSSRPGMSKRRWMPQLQDLLHQVRQRIGKKLQTRQAVTALRVVGVEYASNASDIRATVSAKREIIVAAGALHTPQLLMLSGIGGRVALSSAGVKTRIDLPGVGQNLQDHVQVECWYPYRNTSFLYPNQLNADQALVNQSWTDYWTTRSGPFTSGAINGVAFPSLPDTTSSFATIAELAASQSAGQFFQPNTDLTIVAGFAKQLPLLVNALTDRNRAAWEIINANDGDLAVANMRPFSRGTIILKSNDPFVPPLVNPRYGSSPIDNLVLQAAIWFNARLVNTKSMSELGPVFVAPKEKATMDNILQHIRARSRTEYHVSGTAAMMPRQLGGVVDSKLLVYGSTNLRIVDASIFPLVPAAHLQAVVYGVAEKAADIIKSSNKLASKSRSSAAQSVKRLSTIVLIDGMNTKSPTMSAVLTTFTTTYTT